MKKILSLILAGLMTVSCAAFVAADDAAVEATDPTQAYAISFLAQNGIYHGKSNEEFVAAAADPIERYQMALFVARISTGWVDDYKWDYNYDWEDNTANNSTFTDLAGTAAESYLGAISYANQKGIIEGYSATKFGPTDGITYRDALTMVVRTMGYQGLIYPWGYIEKAVELGLTEGIEGVTYTDALNRGQVAVILYNAMFAPCKGGETLAKSIFDVDFGWETIVITASDEVGFANNGKRAAAGYVGFNIVDENGKIGAKTYYVKEAELGLDAGHAAELAVGSLYNALFTIDGDLASLVDYDSALIATVVNNGITDNKGVAYEKLPMLVTLEDYVLVKENYGKEYITFMGNEMFVYEAGTYTYYVDAPVDAKLVAIDKDTCNIMYWNQETGAWTIGWYYNETLNKYYRYEIDSVYDTLQVDWMSDAEFTKWYAEVSKLIRTEQQYVLKTSFADFGKNPYAKLSLYNADADAAAEVATYKGYKIGSFSNTTEKCYVNANGVDHSAGVAMPTYTLTGLDGAYTREYFVEAGHEKHDPNYYANIAAGNGYAWINVADDVIGFVNEDGSYNNGVVVYNYNELTGELEVVKYIPENAEGTDADSYIFTGVLQAYSTKGTSITVDGEKYFYGYDALDGNTLYKTNANGELVARTLVAEELDQYLMQYVKVLVVDGLVVDVDLLNSSREVIVVYDYAGVTSDGYIAVYGYSTADGVLKIYKINSYNGWKKGDYRYYPANASDDKAFDEGTLYVIKSHDAETDSYGVETYQIDEKADAIAEASTITIEKGYRVITGAYASVEKAAASDCYIIITTNAFGYYDFYVVNGALVDNGFDATGKILYKDGGKIVMFADVLNAWDFTLNANDAGFVLYDKDISTVLEAAYDDAQGVEDYYLLGSTASEVRVFNLLTGKYDYVIAANNIDLEDGHVYRTVGNTIISCVDWDLTEYASAAPQFVNAIKSYYKSDVVDTAKYVVPADNTGWAATYAITKAADGSILMGNTAIKVAIADELNLLTGATNASVKAKIADAYISEIRYRLVTEIGTELTIDDAAIAVDHIYYGNVVYNVADKVAIVYIYAEDTLAITDTDYAIDGADAALIAKWTYSNDVTDVESALKVDWAGSIEKTGNVVTGATIDELGIFFETILAEHDDIAKAGYIFGMDDDHDASHFGFNNSYIRVAINDVVYADYRADEMILGYFKAAGEVDFADCDMIDAAWVEDLGISMEVGDKVTVRFFIQGDDTTNSVDEGNNVEVAVAFTLTASGMVASVYGDVNVNGTAFAAGAVDQQVLNSITIDLIND